MTVSLDIARLTPGREAGIAYLRRPGTAGGRALVLLHGIGSNARSFAPLIDAVPPALDVIAWHAPGYGGSQPLAQPQPTPEAYAGALTSLLDALRLDRVILLGHSLGCLFAARFAARHAERVSALALLSPALGYRVSPGGVMPATVQSRIDEIVALGPHDFAAKRAARLVYRAEAKPVVLAAVREAMAAVDPQGYVQATHALAAGDLIADAARLNMKTLVAVGAEDVVTPPANARSLFAALPHPAGYHEVADAGHALPQEKPVEIARLLSQLIEVSDA